MNGIISRATGKLEKCSPVAITAVGIIYELTLGLLDYSTPEEMSFTIFYLLGVAFVGWGAGSRAAVLVSAISAGIMAAHERTSLDRGPLGVGVSFWNSSSRFLLFCAAGWLAAEVTRLNRHLQGLVEARTTQLRAETEKHKATSAQLSEALARLRTIIANVPMVIFAVDRKGMITFEDGRALNSLGIAPGTHVGQSILKAYGQSREIPNHMRRALEGEEFSASVEIGPVSLQTWYSPTRDVDGSTCGYTGVAVNVTDQRRLERQILEISDREQARIGQEIHDGLCQHLVSLAFDANSLQTELDAQKLPEAQKAGRIASFLDQAITEARQLARGLFPIRLEAQGLPSALEELARTTRERFEVQCRFDASEEVLVESTTLATHLYRIAQEAINNAMRHGQAGSIILRLRTRADQLELEVEDDGQGISVAKVKNCGGMGLHIMEYRAHSIGGSFSFGPGPKGGTLISCCVPGGID
jgi:signal transduction histidine kinase